MYVVQSQTVTYFVDSVVLAECAAVPAGLDPHQGVGHRQRAQEQHQQQQHQVKVVGPDVKSNCILS